MTARGDNGAVREIVIPGDPPLAAILGVPDAANGLVIFAHGSGSGRLIPTCAVTDSRRIPKAAEI